MKCDWCKEEMTSPDTKSCGPNEGAIPFGYDATSREEQPDRHNGEVRCHDCGVIDGGFHHPGCDMEKCVRCGGQAISCGCGREDDEAVA